MPKDNWVRAPQSEKAQSLVASAVRYPGKVRRAKSPGMQWQTEAWRHYDICGEFRYGVNYVANVLSRATLHAAMRGGSGTIVESTSAAAKAAMDELFGGPDGQVGMKSALGLHLSVAGEAFIVGREMEMDDETTEEVYEVVGVNEMKVTGKKWSIDYGDGHVVELTEDAVIIRVWRPHPRHRMQADSPARALLPVLNEIEYLTRHIFSQVTSRLAGAGILVLPQSMTFPTRTVTGPDGNVIEVKDAFMEHLTESMLEPLSDPSSPSAHVPTIITVPDDVVDKIQHLTFYNSLDEQALDLRKEAIHRLALGMDLPPEILTGTSDQNHWGAWQMEESSIKAHIEPMLELITQALTTGYLQVATGNKADLVAFDTSTLRLRPNRSKEAIELYGLGELSAEALRRETGFDEDDAMDDAERTDWFTRKVASGSTTPELVAQALTLLGVPVISQDPRMAPEVPQPSLEDYPVRELPDREAASNSASVIAACEVLVYRTLERAGNRIRSKTGVHPPGVAAADVYLELPVRDLDDALSDAWSCVPRVMAGYGVDTVALSDRMNAYVKHLIVAQVRHDRNLMVRYLAKEQF